MNEKLATEASLLPETQAGDVYDLGPYRMTIIEVTDSIVVWNGIYNSEATPYRTPIDRFQEMLKGGWLKRCEGMK